MRYSYKLQALKQLIDLILKQLPQVSNLYTINSYPYYEELCIARNIPHMLRVEIQRTLGRTNLSQYDIPYLLINTVDFYPYGYCIHLKLESIGYISSRYSDNEPTVNEYDLHNIPVIDWKEQQELHRIKLLLDITG